MCTFYEILTFIWVLGILNTGMRSQVVIIIFIEFLLSACSNPKQERNYHAGLTKVWKNKDLNWNATSLTVNDALLFGTILDNTIFKVDILNGNTIWESKGSTSYSGQKPLIANDKIFLGGSNVLNSYDMSGNLQWSIKTDKKIGHTIIHNNSLVFGSLTNKGLQAYDKTNGELKWEQEPNYQMLSSSKPAIRDSLLVIGDFDYSLDKNFSNTKLINANNGEILWARKNEKYLTGEAVFNNEITYICFDSAYVEGKVSALDLKTGSTIWEVNSNPQIHIRPLITHNSILIPSYKRGLDCLDLVTGKLNWTLDDEDLVPGTKFIEFNGLVFYGSQLRKFVGVSLEGKIQIQSDFEYGIGTPLIFENSLYVPDGNENLFKLENMP